MSSDQRHSRFSVTGEDTLFGLEKAQVRSYASKWERPIGPWSKVINTLLFGALPRLRFLWIKMRQTEIEFSAKSRVDLYG